MADVRLTWACQVATTAAESQLQRYWAALELGPARFLLEAEVHRYQRRAALLRFYSPCCSTPMGSAGDQAIACTRCKRVYDSPHGVLGFRWPGEWQDTYEWHAGVVETWLTRGWGLDPLTATVLRAQLLDLDPNGLALPVHFMKRFKLAGAEAAVARAWGA